MASIWDKRISISIFGEPDAPAMGVTIGNLPVGEYINAEELANYMARRVPNLGDAAEAAHDRSAALCVHTKCPQKSETAGR